VEREKREYLLNIPVDCGKVLLENLLQVDRLNTIGALSLTYVIDQGTPFGNRCIHEKLLPRQVTLKLLMSFSTSLS
jgi:hypothetical protein